MRSPRSHLISALALIAALGSTRVAQSQPPGSARLAEAKQHMHAGAAFYNDPSGHKCEEAYREFKKAFDLSGSFNAMKGMAVCSLELERDGEAINEYQTYLAGKGAQVPPDERAQVESDLKALRAAVASVTLSADRGGVRVTDVRTPSAGYPITNKYVTASGGVTIGMHPGTHTFTASVEGSPDLVWQTEIANGGTYAHVFEFDKIVDEAIKPPPPPPPVVFTRPVPKSVFVMGGLTLALAVPTTVFGVRSLAKERSYKSSNGNVAKATATQLREDVKSANTISDVFLGITAASLITTGVLFFARPSVPASPKSGSWAVSPMVGQNAGALVTGSF